MLLFQLMIQSQRYESRENLHVNISLFKQYDKSMILRRFRNAHMLGLTSLQRQNFSLRGIVILCVVLLFAQFMEAEHATDPDCGDLFCVLCHANGEEEHDDNCSLPMSLSNPAVQKSEFPSSLLDNTPLNNLRIRAPPL